MVHVARRLLGAFVVLAIVAGITLALSSRPRLETDRNAVERDWRPVRTPLDSRYQRVVALANDIDGAGGPTNPIVGDVKDAYANWHALGPNGKVADEIAAANTLEGLSRRLTATVKHSLILSADRGVQAGLSALNQAQIPTGVTPLEDSIAKYEKDRGGALRRLVAGPLGYQAIPRLALATGS